MSAISVEKLGTLMTMTNVSRTKLQRIILYIEEIVCVRQFKQFLPLAEFWSREIQFKQ